MKTALICMMQLHKNSGSARTAFENIRYFKTQGFQVHVISMTVDKTLLQSLGVIVHKTLPWIKGTGLWRRRWYDYQVQRLRKKLKPTLTVGHGDISDQDVLTLHNSVFLASELIHGRALDPKSEMSITHGEILKKQSFKKMIANSKLMKNDTIKRFGVPENKIEVVYPALDTKTFCPLSASDKKNLRARFHFNDKVVIALVTSGNFKKRGLDLFLEAIDLLPTEIKNKANFRVVGKDENGKYQHTLITFDPSLDDIQNYFNAIDVFVLPARIEEFGRVVLEAMGCALPVITTDKVGASELLAGESAQFVIPSHNAQALARAITTLVQSPELREQIGQLNAALAVNEAESKLSEKFNRVFLDI